VPGTAQAKLGEAVVRWDSKSVKLPNGYGSALSMVPKRSGRSQTVMRRGCLKRRSPGMLSNWPKAVASLRSSRLRLSRLRLSSPGRPEGVAAAGGSPAAPAARRWSWRSKTTRDIARPGPGFKPLSGRSALSRGSLSRLQWCRVGLAAPGVVVPSQGRTGCGLYLRSRAPPRLPAGLPVHGKPRQPRPVAGAAARTMAGYNKPPGTELGKPYVMWSGSSREHLMIQVK
jgi:hypothetical protein